MGANAESGKTEETAPVVRNTSVPSDVVSAFRAEDA